MSEKFDSGDQARVSYGQWTTPGPDQSAMRSPDGDMLPAVENFSRSRSGVAKVGVLGALVLLLGGQMVLSAGVGSAAELENWRGGDPTLRIVDMTTGQLATPRRAFVRRWNGA